MDNNTDKEKDYRMDSLKLRIEFLNFTRNQIRTLDKIPVTSMDPELLKEVRENVRLILQ